MPYGLVRKHRSWCPRWTTLLTPGSTPYLCSDEDLLEETLDKLFGRTEVGYKQKFKSQFKGSGVYRTERLAILLEMRKKTHEDFLTYCERGVDLGTAKKKGPSREEDWKKRTFYAQEGKLTYSSVSGLFSSAEVIKTVSLKGATIEDTPQDDKNADRPNCLDIFVPAEKRTYLIALDKEAGPSTFKNWLRAIGSMSCYEAEKRQCKGKCKDIEDLIKDFEEEDEEDEGDA